MIQIDAFKEDVWQAIWDHAKRLFKPLAIIAILFTLISYAVVFLGFSSIFGPEIMEIMQEGSTSFSLEDMQERNERISEAMMGINPAILVGGMLLIYGIMFVVGSWFLNMILTISGDHLMGNQVSLMDSFKSSFNKKVWTILGAIVLIFLAAVAMVILAALLSRILGPFLMFVSLFVIYVALLRFCGAFGAIVHGDLGAMDAIKHSWATIRWKSAIKVFLLLIGVAIIAGLLMLLVQGIVGFSGALGGVISVLFFFALNVMFTALEAAGLSAAFFRYADVNVVQESDSDDIVLSE